MAEFIERNSSHLRDRVPAPTRSVGAEGTVKPAMTKTFAEL